MNSHKTITELCRDLRKNSTPAEGRLWQKLRNRKVDGFKFLRQYPITHSSFKNKPCFFIADFYCAKKRLVIEVDGSIHQYQKEYDEQRDIIIKEKQILTIRFTNEEILFDLNNVILKIQEIVNSKLITQ